MLSTKISALITLACLGISLKRKLMINAEVYGKYLKCQGSCGCCVAKHAAAKAVLNLCWHTLTTNRFWILKMH